jgi:hypothetical protein
LTANYTLYLLLKHNGDVTLKSYRNSVQNNQRKWPVQTMKCLQRRNNRDFKLNVTLIQTRIWELTFNICQRRQSHLQLGNRRCTNVRSTAYSKRKCNLALILAYSCHRKLSHKTHTSLEWVRFWCLARSDALLNALLHPGYSHMYGFSPVWDRRCVLRFSSLE